MVVVRIRKQKLSLQNGLSKKSEYKSLQGIQIT